MSPLKKKVFNLLKEKNFSGLRKLSASDKKVIGILISFSYNKKNQISWRAMEAIGLITGEMAKSNPEIARNIAGRLLWMIRDESGGIGWSAPEILGEIVRNNPELCSDIAPIIASFHNEKMLTSGVLWAIGRIGKNSAEMIEYAIPITLSYLKNKSHILRGYAAWALGEIGTSKALSELEKLKNDNYSIDFYENGELKKKTVGEIAVDALVKLRNNC